MTHTQAFGQREYGVVEQQLAAAAPLQVREYAESSATSKVGVGLCWKLADHARPWMAARPS